MNVLVTGGAGFIGFHVVRLLMKNGHNVTVLDDFSGGHPNRFKGETRVFNYDICDPRCEEVFREGDFYGVIHLAAQTSVKKSMEDPCHDAQVNLLGLVNMLQLSSRYRVTKFLFASSAAVYGEKKNMPLTELDGLNPKSPYGISKLAGELYCTQWHEISHLKPVIFRFSNVYGPGQKSEMDGSVVPTFLDLILKKKPIRIHGDGNQTRDFLFVEDLAEGLNLALMKDLSGIYNISSNQSYSINNIVEIMAKIPLPVEKEFHPERPGDIRNSRLDSTRFSEATGWKPRYTFERGLLETLTQLDFF